MFVVNLWPYIFARIHGALKVTLTIEARIVRFILHWDIWLNYCFDIYVNYVYNCDTFLGEIR